MESVTTGILVRRGGWPVKKGIRKMALAVVCAAALVLGMAVSVPAGTPCPWRISKIGVGKWANGNKKAGTWIGGSFPVNIPGTTERPDWAINGSPVGKSQAHFNLRWIPNSSSRFNPGDNTVKVEFIRHPYQGAFHQCRIKGFNWDQVPNGGYKYYNCQ